MASAWPRPRPSKRRVGTTPKHLAGQGYGVVVRGDVAGVEAPRRNLTDWLERMGLLGTAFLAGIGFTMALFIGGPAFPGTPFESQAKLAILLGSLLAAAVGIAVQLTTRSLEADP